MSGRCVRENCGGWLLIDEGRQVCSLCAREPNAPEPPPLIVSHDQRPRRYLNLTPEEIATLDAASRAKKAAQAKERRRRESHFVSKNVGVT